jgi:predicted secreted protein
MGWFTGIVLFILIWWTALFAVLPLGQEPESEADPVSGVRGVPRSPRVGRVVIITTLVSVVIWAGCDALISSDWLSFRHGILAFHPD